MIHLPAEFFPLRYRPVALQFGASSCAGNITGIMGGWYIVFPDRLFWLYIIIKPGTVIGNSEFANRSKILLGQVLCREQVDPKPGEQGLPKTRLPERKRLLVQRS